jgi:hypothetical protein
MHRYTVGTQDSDDSESTEKILYDDCYVDIQDRELVPAVMVASQTSVAREEPRQRAAEPLNAVQPPTLKTAQPAQARGPAQLQAPAWARAPARAWA